MTYPLSDRRTDESPFDDAVLARKRHLLNGISDRGIIDAEITLGRRHVLMTQHLLNGEYIVRLFI